MQLLAASDSVKMDDLKFIILYLHHLSIIDHEFSPLKYQKFSGI